MPEIPDGLPAPQRAASDDDFGPRLRQLRTARGWSLAELGRAACVSKPHLSSLERGSRSPSARVAAACDDALDAGGALVDLARLREEIVPRGGVGRRRTSALTEEEYVQILEVHRDLFRGVRRLAQSTHPDATIPLLKGGAQVLADAAARCGRPAATELWALAARYAEFTGWMFQERGDDVTALRWTALAVSWAAEGGDQDMAFYELERQALIMLYRGDAAGTVEAARQAGRASDASDRIRALAARREAQGHALLKNASECRRALDRAAELLAAAPAPYPRGESWGPNSIADTSRLVEGWCLTDLGRHEEAVALLTTDLALVPDNCHATRSRFTVRLALALARQGDIPRACAVTRQVLPYLDRLGSATLRADARSLSRVLAGHRRRECAAMLVPRLDAVLRTR